MMSMTFDQFFKTGFGKANDEKFTPFDYLPHRSKERLGQRRLA